MRHVANEQIMENSRPSDLCWNCRGERGSEPTPSNLASKPGVIVWHGTRSTLILSFVVASERETSESSEQEVLR